MKKKDMKYVPCVHWIKYGKDSFCFSFFGCEERCEITIDTRNANKLMSICHYEKQYVLKLESHEDIDKFITILKKYNIAYQERWIKTIDADDEYQDLDADDEYQDLLDI